MGTDEFTKAMTNRSLRTIKAELEFLADASVLTPAQLSTILSHLPDPSSTVSYPSAPTASLSNLSLNNGIPTPMSEKTGYYGQPPQSSTPNPPPPAYPSAPPAPSALTYAVALYMYNAQDAGDLALAANDRIAVTEYMNAEWWKGRNERTGAEGIFPRSYVRVEDGKLPVAPVQPQPQPTNYGNMPLEVSQSGSGGGKVGEGKGAEMGKKFGKKLGNAAIFGAGASIGSNIVNGIF